jgi:hypothetical protein
MSNNTLNLTYTTVIVIDTAMSLQAELTSYMIHLVNITEKAYVGLHVVMCAPKHFTQSVILANW